MRLHAATGRRARVSLIPLIDVMLVLLFFFMLATSYVDSGRTRLELAAAAQGRAGGEADSTRLLVLADGRLQFQGETRALVDWLPVLQARPPGDALSVSPAPGLPLQTLLSSWQALQAAGLNARLAAEAP